MTKNNSTHLNHSEHPNGFDSHRLNLNPNSAPAPAAPPPLRAPPSLEHLQLLRDDHRTRHGKIAQLPSNVRDELCLRLEEGQPAPQIIDWLHSLPDVLKTLDDHFDGSPINKQNLSAWRQGGYLEWQISQELAESSESLSNTASKVHETGLGRTLADDLASVLAAQFCRLLARWDGQPDPQFDAKLRLLERLNKAIALLQKTTYHTLRQQAQLDRDELADNLHEAEIHKQDRLAKIMVPFEARNLSRLFGDSDLGKKLARHIAEIKAGVPSTYNPDDAKPQPVPPQPQTEAAQPQSTQVKPTPPIDSTPADATLPPTPPPLQSSPVKPSQAHIPEPTTPLDPKKPNNASTP